MFVKSLSIVIIAASIIVYALLSHVSIADMVSIFERADWQLQVFMGFLLFINTVALITGVYLFGVKREAKKAADK